MRICTTALLIVLLVGAGARAAIADPGVATGTSPDRTVHEKMLDQGYTDAEIEARLSILSTAEHAQLARRPASLQARGGENVSLDADGSPVVLLFLGFALVGIGLACMA
jgi:hypothetical protein